jgi:hypothetical protein
MKKRLPLSRAPLPARGNQRWALDEAITRRGNASAAGTASRQQGTAGSLFGFATNELPTEFRVSWLSVRSRHRQAPPGLARSCGSRSRAGPALKFHGRRPHSADNGRRGSTSRPAFTRNPLAARAPRAAVDIARAADAGVAGRARLSAWAAFFPWRARAKPIGKDHSDRHAAAPSIAQYPD